MSFFISLTLTEVALSLGPSYTVFLMSCLLRSEGKKKKNRKSLKDFVLCGARNHKYGGRGSITTEF